MKMYPGRGGPSKSLKKPQYQENSTEVRVANPATLFRAFCSSKAPISISIVNFKNTQFVNILLDKKFYSKIELASNNLGIKPDKIIGNALLTALKVLSAYGYTVDEPKEEKAEHIIV